jgi:hypothetical protein
MTLILSGTDGLSDIDGTAATPAIRGTDANTGIFFPAADNIGIATAGAEVARFDGSGNMGIGTSSPTKKLTVLATNLIADFRSSAASSQIDFTPTTYAAWRIGAGVVNVNDFGIYDVTNAATRMIIDASGNVGIGTATPSTQLQINSGAVTYSDQLRIRNTNFGNADIGVGSGIMAVATDMSNIAFYTSSNLGTTGSALPNNERMRIDSSGNVQLSTGATSFLNSSGRKILNQTGSVLQVVNATYATQTSATTGTMVDTGLTATITPSSTSSKILVIVQQAGCGKQTNDVTLQLRLMRGATELFEFESAGAYTGSGATNIIGTCGTAYLDSPATASAVTYKTQMSAFSAGATVYTQFNVGSGTPTSTITLMEIAG